MASSVKDIDRGAKSLLARMAKAKGLTLSVGIHESEGGATRGNLTVADIATIHEFGTGTIPQRSFLRAWADENASENQALIKAIGEQAVKGLDIRTGLDRLGLKFVGSIQGRMVAGIPPPNAPSTIAHKGSSTPLIDTGQLKSSIRHKVEGGGG